MDYKKTCSYVKLFSKKVRTKDNRTFTAYYAVIQERKGDKFVDKETTNYDNKRVALSIRVVLTDKARAFVETDKHCPYMVELDNEAKNSDGTGQFFITIDKDKDGVVKLDKYGKKHPVLIIREFNAIEQAERKSITFDDVATLNEVH